MSRTVPSRTQAESLACGHGCSYRPKLILPNSGDVGEFESDARPEEVLEVGVVLQLAADGHEQPSPVVHALQRPEARARQRSRRPQQHLRLDPQRCRDRYQGSRAGLALPRLQLPVRDAGEPCRIRGGIFGSGPLPISLA